MLIRDQTRWSRLSQFAWLALGNLNGNVRLVNDILLVIIVVFINVYLVFFIILALFSFICERSAGFFVTLIVINVFKVLFKIVIFFKFNFVQVLNQSLLFLALFTGLRLFLSLYNLFLIIILPFGALFGWPQIQGRQNRQQTPPSLKYWRWQRQSQEWTRAAHPRSLRKVTQQASQ